MGNPESIVGQRFGRLLVTDTVWSYEEKRTLMVCQCDCGRIKNIKKENLISGSVRSCGCIHTEQLRDMLCLDLVGERYGKLVVLQRESNSTHWLCQCDCGNTTSVTTGDLRSGHTKSCGCNKGKTSQAGDLTGKKFNRLLVLRRQGSRNKMKTWWCRCDCGNELEAYGSYLVRNRTKSCGCLQREEASEVNRTHGGSGTRLYNIWKGMLSRCDNPTETGWEHYGGCGISYDETWGDFTVFRSWSETAGYSDTLTLDRINPFRNYGPDNCRWIPLGVQQLNKREHCFKCAASVASSVVGAHCSYTESVRFLREYLSNIHWVKFFERQDFDLLDNDSVDRLSDNIRVYVLSCCELLDYYYEELSHNVTDAEHEERFRRLRLLDSELDVEGRICPEITIDEFYTFIQSNLGRIW